MTFLSKDIRDHLAGSVNIVNDVGDNIYADAIPQSKNGQNPFRPEKAIVINDLSNDPAMYLGGESGTHVSQIQIDYWTDGKGSAAVVNAGTELIRNRLNGYKGQFGTGCYGVAHMLRNNSVAAPPFNGSDVHRRRGMMDFEITHTADVPTFT